MSPSINPRQKKSRTLQLLTLEDRVNPVTLALGDIAFTGVQPATPDRISFVLLKNVDTGTVITFEDNAWTGTAMTSAEGKNTLTFNASFTAGTQFNYLDSRPANSRWAVGTNTVGLSDVTSGSFALSTAGDNLLAYNGTTIPTTGNHAGWIAAYSTGAYLTSGSATLNTTYLPSAFTVGNNAFTLNGSGINAALTTPASISNNAAGIRTTVYTLSNWTPFSTADSVPIPSNTTFTVTGLNSAPTLNGANSLTAIAEDVPSASNTGTLVSALIAGQVFDPDSTPLSGIAIVAVDNTNGAWEYSTNGGSLWNSLSGVSAANARLLSDEALSRVRFVPNANFNGTLTGLTFRAWDQTSGTTSSTASTTINGVETAFSSTTATASIIVTAVNDAPVNTVPSNFAALTSSTVTFSGSRLISIADADAGGNTVQVSLSVSAGTLTLSGSTGLSFSVGSATNNGSMTFTGTISAVNTALNGMTFAVPATPQNVTLTINTNDLTNSGSGGALNDNDIVTITAFDGLFINEMLFNPTVATDSSLEYVEIRGKPNVTIPAGVYLVGIEGDSGSPGQVQTIFNLSGVTLGSNGYLVLLQQGHPYTVNPAATALTSEAVGYSGLPGIIFSAEVGSDIENAAASFLLIQTGTVPSLANDIDANNDGVADGTVYTGWTILDSVGVADDATDTGYASIIFATNGNVVAPGAVVVNIASGEPEYVGRTSDTTGSAASDWVGGDTIGTSPNWTLAVGQTTPALYAGAALNHIGSTNFPTVGANQAPVNSVPSAQTILEEGSRVFNTANGNLISVSDSDAGSNAVQVSLTSTGGTMTLSSGTGLSFSTGGVAASATKVFTGTITAINNSLAGMTFNATPNFNGTASIQIVTNDLGNTGTGGAKSDTDTVTINVTSVNDPPTGSNNAITINEDSTHTFNTSQFTLTDANDTPANTLAAIVITALPAAGSLKKGVVDVVLNQSILASEIGQLTYTPAFNGNGSPYATFAFQVQDNGGTTNGGIDFDPTARTFTINVTPVNDPPTGSNNAITINEDNTHTFGTSQFTLTDANDTPAHALAAVIITTLPTVGTLKRNSVNVVANQSISATDITNGLLTYTPAFNGNGSPYATFTFQVQDNGGTSNGGIDLDPMARTFTINVTPINDAPTALTLQNVVASLPENTSTAMAIKVADLVVTDDEEGTNGFTITGLDQNFFEVIGTELRLKANTTLDFETKSSYSITVNVDDTGAGGTPDASFGYTLSLTDVNAVPTAVNLVNTTMSLSENTSTAVAIHLADIIVTDDNEGTNILSVVGADNTFLEIAGTALRLKAGVDLDAVAKPSYTVTIHVDDTSVGGTPDLTTTFTLTVLPNQVPVLTRNTATLTGAEGSTLTNSGTVADGDGNPVTLTANVGTVVNNGDGTWNWSLPLPDGPLPTTTVTITGNDGFGGIGTTTFTYAATNVAPTATGISGPTVRQIGASGTYSLAGVNDLGSGDVSSLRYSFALSAAGLATNHNGASNTNSATFTFPTAGTPTIYARVYDKDGGISTTQQLNVLVANLPTTATITTTLPPTTPPVVPVIVRNQLQSFTVSNVVDAAMTNANFSLKWDWDGDGVMDPEDFTLNGLPYGSMPQTRSYNFPTLGLRTVRITVSDDGSNAATTYSFPVDVRALALQPNGELWVGGTTANNTITLSQPTATSVRVVLDNVAYGPFGSTQNPLTAIRVFGQAGTDSITLAGNDGNDVFEILDDVVADSLRDKEFTFNGLPISTLNVENYALNGGNGNDTFRVRGLGVLVPNTSNVFLEGAMGADRIVSELTLADVGNNSRADWIIEGPQRGRLENNLTFNWVEEITANGLDDYFTFLNGASMPSAPGLTAGIVGGAGMNTMNMSASTTAISIVVTGLNTLNTSVGPVVGITNMLGSNATTDRITGYNDVTLWTIAGANSGSFIINDDPEISFAAFEVLVAGTDDDTFNMLPNGTMGSIDGGSGTGHDTLSYASRTTSTNITLSPPTAPSLGSWTSFEAIEGGSSSNRLTAANGTNIWTITGKNAGTLNALAFAGFDSLVGGTSTDTFIVRDEGDIGTIAGGNGANTLSYAGNSSAVVVTLASTSSGSGTRVGSFSAISSLVGGSGIDTLAGTTGADTFMVTATTGGTINISTTFSAFENLDGGNGNDQFRMTTTLLPLAITSLVGGTGNDTLMGANRTNQFAILGSDAGTLNLALNFTGVEHLTGGSGTDSFTFTAGSISGVLNGGGGNDVLNVGANGSVNLANSTSTILGTPTAFVSMESFLATNGTFTGANASNIWRLSGWDVGTLNSVIAFNGFGNIIGGSVDDRLQMYQGGLTGTFNAGAGNDILDYTGTTMPRPYTTFVGTLVNGQFRTGILNNPLMNVLSFEVISGNIYG